MIDVSSYQGVIDWQKVRAAGIERAYVKWGEWWASRDAYVIDPQAERNIEGCRNHGVQVGLYFFAHPSRSPLTEARWFLRSAHEHLVDGDLPPALDLELTEGHDWSYLDKWKAQWLAAADAATGCRAVFYSYFAFWQRMTLYGNRPVWGAALSATFKPPPTWAIWQHSFTGTVPGITGHVDLDRPLWVPPAIGSGIPAT